MWIILSIEKKSGRKSKDIWSSSRYSSKEMLQKTQSWRSTRIQSEGNGRNKWKEQRSIGDKYSIVGRRAKLWSANRNIVKIGRMKNGERHKDNENQPGSEKAQGKYRVRNGFWIDGETLIKQNGR